MAALAFWFYRRAWIVDDADSHGISEQQSSRLGGVIVFVGATACFVVGGWSMEIAMPSAGEAIFSAEGLPNHAVFALLIGLVGLWDDVVERVQPLVRLLLVFSIALFAFLNGAVPLTEAAYGWLPFGLNNHALLVAVGVVLVTGFVNAGNMADGANGLLGITVLSFVGLIMLDGVTGVELALFVTLSIFLLINIFTGRVFLGDFGAYGLSALVAFGALELYSYGQITLWLFASLLAYPCVEMIRVIIERKLAGISPLHSGNDHLHNYSYTILRARGWRRISANSATGCFLGCASASVPVMLVFSGVIETSNTIFWLIYFHIYLVAHMALVLKLKRMANAG